MVEGKQDHRDVITEYKMNHLFDAYMRQNFDMKNLPKYMEDEARGIFSRDFIIQIFLGAFVWKYMCVDFAKRPLVSERRKYLREGNNEGYKEVIKKMEKQEMEMWESCLFAVKKKVEILEKNYQNSVSKHLPKSQEGPLLEGLQKRAFGYFMQMKVNNAVQSSGIANMGKKEALKIQKECQSL